jgi:hypothetical protein
MPKFRKKPVVIEAIQWLNKKIVVADDGSDPLEWFFQAERNGSIQLAGDTLHIKTLEGTMRADVGDWIIRGVKGELYPCKPDIFEATYEPVQ